MSAEKGSSKTDTLVKVVLVFFISLLSFSVGTFVGKQVSDSDHRRVALEGETHGARDVASADGHGAAEGEKITEKEIDSLTEEFVNKEKSDREPASDEHAAAGAEDGHATEAAADAQGYKSYSRGAKAEKPAPADAHAAPAKPAEKSAAHAPAHDATAAVAEKVAKDKAPSDGMKEERKPAAALPSVASSAVGKYTVQVASYADEKEAKAGAADLKGKGWAAFYLSANVSGKTWYRVLVGLFDNNKSATEMRAQYLKDTGSKTAIVQKIVQ